MRRSKIAIFSSLLLAVPLVLTGCGSDSKTPTPRPERVEAQFVGPARCGACHVDAHDEWKDSWHTRKSTYGPNWPGNFEEGRAKFLPGVIGMWEAGDINSHMVLDRATITDEIKALYPGVTHLNYVTQKKFNWTEVDIIVGETRKQRYAVYYDGSPVTNAHYSYSVNGGANWSIDTDSNVAFAGNPERAGYKFLTIEMDALKNPVEQKSQMYGEFYSWQERCIGCHTTGFDVDAYNVAKEEFVAGNRADLRDLFIADIRISCESCHGAGGKHAESRSKADIINPTKLAKNTPEDILARQLVCGQCHTRTSGNTLHANGSNDNRGFVLGQDTFMEIMEYTRPAWGSGNRQVSNDGKGRRDHQQDMDILLTNYINTELDRGTPHNPHGQQACFDCHNSHGVGNVPGYSVAQVDKTKYTTKGDPDGSVRLKDAFGNVTREHVCGSCHAGQVDEYLAVFDGRAGFEGPNPGFGNFNSVKGRNDRKQHIFSTDTEGRSFGLYPDEYIWAYNGQGATTKANFKAIWPWEREQYAQKGQTILYGAEPWVDGGRTTPNPPAVEQTAFAAQYAGPGACVTCHKDVHGEWKDSWHTKKTTYGPNWAGMAAHGEAKFLPGIIEKWEAGEMDSHVILANASDRITDEETAADVTNKIWITEKKYDWQDVDIIIGETRKQRYAIYNDGLPVDKAIFAISKNGGIGWEVPEGQVAEVFPGDLARAGYKFLTIEVDALKNPPVPKSNMYGTWRSWQEQCIGCHTTGFDVDAWNQAKDDYIAGDRADLKDLFIADIRISCESCHGPGAAHVESRNKSDIINPVDLKGEQRMLVCNQCHTRAKTNVAHGNGANDNRGIDIRTDKYTDIMEYYRPKWGEGDRGVSIDGKGRRDHQQDMDMMLTDHIRGDNSYHGSLACFDCHNSHGVGNVPGYAVDADKNLFTTKGDLDGSVRMKESPQTMCGSCHIDVEKVLGVLNGRTGFGEDDGFKKTGYGDWDTPYGRADRKQHIFATDREGRSFGLFPEEYVWAVKVGVATANATQDDLTAIWPWEKAAYQADGHEIYIGPRLD